MKLLLCPQCQDVVKLTRNGRYCECGSSWGKYLDDGLNAQISGKAIPLGFANGSMVDAIHNRPKSGDGSRFTAFVIPVKCPTIAKISHKIVDSSVS